MQGEDEPECLTASRTTPCRTISYALTGGHHKICMNGTFNNISENIQITKTHSGNNKHVIRIGCMSCLLENSNITFNSSPGKTARVSFVNLTIRDSSIMLQTVFVTFKNVSLEQATIQDSEKASTFIYFEDCNLLCFDTETCGMSLLSSTIVKSVFRRSHLNNFKLNLNTQDLMLIMDDTTIQQPNINVRVQSRPYLRIPAFIYFHNVSANPHSTSFRAKRSVDPLHPNSEIKLDLTNPYIHINKCNFYKTHLEIIANRRDLDQAYFWGALNNTEFTNTKHEGDGGALRITSDVPNSKLHISGCIFANNSAVKSTSALKGYGGGISVSSPSLQVGIKNTVFLGNKASDAGLHLYTSIGVTVSLSNCSFIYSVDPAHPIQEALVFIAGTAIQIQSNFKVTYPQPQSYVGPISLFYMSKVKELNIGIACPDWYWHNIPYVSPSSGSNALTDVRYECNPCADNFYTTSAKGNSLSYVANTSVLINTANTDQTGNTCLKCEYGSICTGNDVIPRPNYWGYWHEGKLVFQQCPASYCCSGSDSSICSVYDYCAGKKTGTLCGACQDGFSVAILTGSCTANTNCGNEDWFWLFAILVALAYALWYTLKDDIFHLFFGTITYIRHLCNRPKSRGNIIRPVPSNSGGSLTNIEENTATVEHETANNGKDEATSQNESDVTDDKEGDVDDDVDKGYFGIVTYYVQMAAVITIQIEFSDIDQSESFVDKIVNNIARFLNLELTQLTFDVCPIVGLTTVGKHLYNLFFLFGIYISWAGVFIVTIIIVAIVHKVGSIESLAKKFDSFKLKLVGGFIEIIKYTYAGFCGIIFMSLVCAQIGNKYVWWYDGTNVCLENWQIVIVVFATFYAVPFPLALALGMKLLKQNKISPVCFVCCCLIPLPAIFILLILLNRKSKKLANTPLSDASETVISVLQGPYREDDKHLTLYWEAMVSVRRLLITGMTLVGYASIRMIIITALSLIFLVQHNYTTPFQVRSSNDVEALSLSLLLLASVLNLLKASLTDAGVVPSGPSVSFFKTVELCEKLFVLAIIAYILVVELKGRKRKKNIQNTH